MVLDQNWLVAALALAAAALAGLLCGGWMVFGDLRDLDGRVTKLEDLGVERGAHRSENGQ